MQAYITFLIYLAKYMVIAVQGGYIYETLFRDR